MLLPIEGDFINLPPTLPRKSNFLQLSKGYSWNIYRQKIKLESWNLSNVWILCLFYSLGIQNTCAPISDTVWAQSKTHKGFLLFMSRLFSECIHSLALFFLAQHTPLFSCISDQTFALDRSQQLSVSMHSHYRLPINCIHERKGVRGVMAPSPDYGELGDCGKINDTVTSSKACK